MRSFDSALIALEPGCDNLCPLLILFQVGARDIITHQVLPPNNTKYHQSSVPKWTDTGLKQVSMGGFQSWGASRWVQQSNNCQLFGPSEELVCVERSPEELRNSTDWASWVDAIRAYGCLDCGCLAPLFLFCVLFGGDGWVGQGMIPCSLCSECLTRKVHSGFSTQERSGENRRCHVGPWLWLSSQLECRGRFLGGLFPVEQFLWMGVAGPNKIGAPSWWATGW